MSKSVDLKEQLRSPLTWHVLLAGVLGVAVLVLGVRLTLDIIATSTSKSDEMRGRQVKLQALEIQTAPLRGLDKRVEDSKAEISRFFSKRIPMNYSTIAIAVGNVAVKNSVRMTRVQYTPDKPADNLTEVALDMTVGGEYTNVMRFVNGLEREQQFFVIRKMQLTGQQGGTVNLRLNISTWMRPADADALPKQDAEDADGAEADKKSGNTTPKKEGK